MSTIQTLASLVPLVSFLALASAVFIFVKNKANVDALKESVAAWQGLAEAYKEQIDELERKVDCLSAEIEKLRKSVEVERKATKVAVDEILAGIKRVEER